MISDRHQRIVAHRSRLMVQGYGQFVSGTAHGRRPSAVGWHSSAGGVCPVWPARENAR
jgi:hypothetical protein